MNEAEPTLEERTFAELRRKIREAELLSAATEKLLRALRFSGRPSAVAKNGCILKSGYEEGYFTRPQEERWIPRNPIGRRGARSLSTRTHKPMSLARAASIRFRTEPNNPIAGHRN